MMGAYECLIIVRHVKGQHAAATTEGGTRVVAGRSRARFHPSSHTYARIGAEMSGTYPRPDISR
jgi:hypothetical protein